MTAFHLRYLQRGTAVYTSCRLILRARTPGAFRLRSRGALTRAYRAYREKAESTLRDDLENVSEPTPRGV
jgi:hypothetical protein